jgi:hypothetical protein
MPSTWQALLKDRKVRVEGLHEVQHRAPVGQQTEQETRTVRMLGQQAHPVGQVAEIIEPGTVEDARVDDMEQRRRDGRQRHAGVLFRYFGRDE